MHLAICEICEISDDKDIIIHSTIGINEFFNNEYSDLISNLREQYLLYLSIWADRFPPHHISQHHFMINNPFINIEIIHIDEQTCFKTYWIRFVQRRWRNIFNKRKDILIKRKRPKALRIRQTTGKWPKGLCHWPNFYLPS